MSAGGDVGRKQLGIILAVVTFFGSILTTPVRGIASESPLFSAFPDALAEQSTAVPVWADLSLVPVKAVPPQAPDRAEALPSRAPGNVPVFSSILTGAGASRPGPETLAATVPFRAVPRDEKDSDLVLSPNDVAAVMEPGEEAEPVEVLDAEFFANAPEEVEKGNDGSYANLTLRIDKFIRYFQTSARDRFEVWLARSGKYSDMMRAILAKYGMPGDLVYLALIESGFSPKAYSVARAAGPWQFIPRTGKRYGLQVNWWVDERRDYEKSTHAAAAYLKDLYGMFDSWPLAAAAYNCGEGKIQRAVSRYKTDDFGTLIRYRYLARETKDYVPKMLAALTIAKNPEKYGFGDVQYEEPLEFDKVAVPGGTDLAALGSLIGVPVESLKELNPQLRRFCTPPEAEMVEIRVPKGFGPVAADRMEEIRTEARVTFLLHKVKKNETLDSLASQYNTPPSSLKELNNLRGDSLQRVAKLVIPVTGLSGEESVPGTKVSPDQLRLAHMRVDEGYRRGQRVRVRKGDSLWKIARRSGVSVQALARANRMKTTGTLRAGSIIRIPSGVSSSGLRVPGGVSSSGNGSRHVVRRGETLWSIARRHGITVNQLADRNNIHPREPLRSGRVLQIPTES